MLTQQSTRISLGAGRRVLAWWEGGVRWVWGGGDCPREGNVESDEVGGSVEEGWGWGKEVARL